MLFDKCGAHSDLPQLHYWHVSNQKNINQSSKKKDGIENVHGKTGFINCISPRFEHIFVTFFKREGKCGIF